MHTVGGGSGEGVHLIYPLKNARKTKMEDPLDFLPTLVFDPEFRVLSPDFVPISVGSK